MTARQRVGEYFLWAALIFLGVIIGASVYQRLSLIPEWGGDLPGSLVSYFQGTTAAASMGRFWTRALPPTALFIAAAFASNWPERERRKWLGVAALLFFAALVWTEVWFVPKGVIPLFVRAGAGMTPQEITERARAWIFWDWFRMAMTVVAYLSMLKALTYRAERPA